jgi:hypothetical protein
MPDRFLNVRQLLPSECPFAARYAATSKWLLYRRLFEKMKRLDQEGRRAEGWGGGDGYFEQVFRIVRALVPELTILILPPLRMLLFAAALGWVLRGFAKA